MADGKLDLDALRSEIDALDRQLLDLLNRRVEVAQAIGRIKGADGKPFFTPERERNVFDKLARDNAGPLLPEQLRAIYREIVSAARAAEQPLRVAFWGPDGSFSHIAARTTFGDSSELMAVESIAEVFGAVEHGRASYGIVPIENAIAGVVPETLDQFPHNSAKICAETTIAVQHHLVSTATDLAEVQRVFAGPQPRMQCRRWLRENLAHAEIIEIAPTSRAAQMALEDPNSAAIANRLGAETIGIPILRERIEDDPKNATRFLVIGYNEPAPTGRDKTSLQFSLRNNPGELYRALGAFEAEGVNLTMIESRPSPRESFWYLFFCDCNGHRQDANVAKALERIAAMAAEVTVLGSYPAASTH